MKQLLNISVLSVLLLLGNGPTVVTAQPTDGPAVGHVCRVEDTPPCKGHITVVGDQPGFFMFAR